MTVVNMTAVADTLRGKYPAKEHARRVAQYIIQNGGRKDGLLYLEAQKSKYNEVSGAYSPVPDATLDEALCAKTTPLDKYKTRF
jgi:hypothetical protein